MLTLIGHVSSIEGYRQDDRWYENEKKINI